MSGGLEGRRVRGVLRGTRLGGEKVSSKMLITYTFSFTYVLKLLNSFLDHWFCENKTAHLARFNSQYVAFRRYGQNTQVAFAGVWGSQLYAWLD